MKRAYTTAVALLLCSTAALAQSSGGSGGSGGTSGGATGSTGTTQGRSSSQNPSTQGTTPGVTAPSPSEGATEGRAPGANPSNPQDLNQRQNPQDMTRPGAGNPQDLSTGTGTPQIAVPERR
jgi:hypothetical protein